MRNIYSGVGLIVFLLALCVLSILGNNYFKHKKKWLSHVYLVPAVFSFVLAFYFSLLMIIFEI